MTESRPGELLNMLPSVFREDPGMADFLAAFEYMLLARGLEEPADPAHWFPDLETVIDQLAESIDPATAPLKDLRWLASWLGLTIDADYPTGYVDAKASEKTTKKATEKETEEQTQYRIFVSQTMSRYQQRGTLAGMKTLLEHFTGQPSDIRQDDKPHGFVVSLHLQNVRNFNEMERLTRVAHALIQREKPAHTYYELKTLFQTFQVADLEKKDGEIRPRAGAYITKPAQVGRREEGKITVGNMMLGQAPL